MGLGLIDGFREVVRVLLGLPADPGKPPSLLHSPLCWAQVKVQHSDGTVDVTPTNSDYSEEQNVQLVAPFPNTVVKVQPGAPVILAWAYGDPSQRMCLPIWGAGATLTSIAIGTSPDAVITKQDLTALINAIQSATYLLATGPGVTGSVATALVFSPPGAYGSNSVKVQR